MIRFANNDYNDNNVSRTDEERELSRDKEAVSCLYLYSDLSIKNIAQVLDISLNEVHHITDRLVESKASRLFHEESTTRIDKIMSTPVVSLDISRTAAHAAALMTEKRVGSVIVTKNDRPFGIVTERDLVRRYYRDTLLERLASHPLISVGPSTTVEKVAEIMLRNKIRKLPVIDENGMVSGMVTVANLAMFLLSTRRQSLTLSILQAVSRGKAPRCDSCNGTSEIQWCDSCNRFMCRTCEDEVHTVDLP